ncbi:hypothetical protein C1645_743558 [Glomus cerebriforme]|uniref:Uncharacterized protein n=1 Tax=Glomus cerebriforme TaxID=658196 RepID=A0A397SFJ2_9GLOM|nr:hypothetical protein C1645_743558 [Glomus cerebriforme]
MDPEETLEYENIEEDLVDENDSEYENYGECESLSNTEKDESEFLFELDFNILAGAKKFAQQNISEEEDNWEDISDVGSDFSDAESYEECDEIIAKLQNNEKLSPCVIIDMLNGEIQWCNSKVKLRQLRKMIGTVHGKLIIKKSRQKIFN